MKFAYELGNEIVTSQESRAVFHVGHKAASQVKIVSCFVLDLPDEGAEFVPAPTMFGRVKALVSNLLEKFKRLICRIL
jgi:hypothetical protein